MTQYRKLETLDGYKPQFSEEELRLGYHCEMVQPKQGKKRPIFQHSITVENLKIIGTQKYHGTAETIAFQIATELLADDDADVLSPAYVWLRVNMEALMSSVQYWEIVQQQDQLHHLNMQLLALKRQIHDLEITTSIQIHELKVGQQLSAEDCCELAMEYGMSKLGAHQLWN